MKRHARILTGLLAALTACALLAGCGASSASNTAMAEIDKGAAADYESAAGASSWGGDTRSYSPDCRGSGLPGSGWCRTEWPCGQRRPTGPRC